MQDQGKGELSNMDSEILREIHEQHNVQMGALSSFREEWIRLHGELQTQLAVNTSKLGELDGRVAKQNGNMAALAKEFVKHKEECPFGEMVQRIQSELDRGEQPPAKAGMARMVELERRIETVEKDSVVSSKSLEAQKTTLNWLWNNFGKAIFGALITALVLLILYHSSIFTHSESSTKTSTTSTESH